MRITRAVSVVAWAPLLSGCMMGGLGHTGGVSWVSATGYADSGRAPAPVQHAEASNAGLTIEISFPTPSSGAAVVIDALLRRDGVHREPTDGDVWLRIQTPGGSVDHLRMQRLHSFPAGTFQARYGFTAAGLYLVTAEGRTGTGADIRTVSVTTGAKVGREAYGSRHDWLTPAALLGGLGMAAMMTLMMVGSAF